MPKASESIQTKKNQHAHHGRHEDKDLQKYMSVPKIPINIKASTHETNSEPPKNYRRKQGSSNELGYQLKGDLSNMYMFLFRQTIEDIHPQRNIYIRNGLGKREQGIQKEVINIQMRLLFKAQHIAQIYLIVYK